MEKIMKTLLITALLASSLMTSASFAARGNSSGGGGDAVSINKANERLLDLVENGDLEYINPVEVVLSYNWFFHNINVLDFFVVNSSEAFSDKGFDSYRFSYFIWKSLGVSNVSIGDLEDSMSHVPKSVTFYFSNNNLDELNDEGKIHITETYNKTQLAIQNEEGVVVIYKPLFEKLTKKDQAGLIMHEVLLRFVWQYNPSHLKVFGTEKIRKLNRQLFKLLDEEFIPKNEITKSFQELGIKTLSK